MANVYEKVLDSYDFFDSCVFDNEDTTEWEQFLDEVSCYAAEDDQSSSNLSSRFESFLYERGYEDKLGDILYDAMKAFVNEYINKTGADFDLI